MDLVYCIKCEKVVNAEGTVSGIAVHEYNCLTEFGYEYDWCDFPMGYTMSAPEVNPDWEMGLVEPSEDEMQMMDENALELLLDIEG